MHLSMSDKEENQEKIEETVAININNSKII